MKNNFTGIVQIKRKEILNKNRKEIAALADEELRSFSVSFKESLLKFWDKLHRTGNK